VKANDFFAGQGDAQIGNYILRRFTNDATQTELSCDGANPFTANRIVLPNNSTYSFKGHIVDHRPIRHLLPAHETACRSRVGHRRRGLQIPGTRYRSLICGLPKR